MSPKAEAAVKGWPLIALAFSAPHIGIRKRWPDVLHAVEFDGLPIKTWPNGLATSACGLSNVRLVEYDAGPVAWPPYVKGLGGYVRCPECFAACSKKKPVSRFVPAPPLIGEGGDW